GGRLEAGLGGTLDISKLDVTNAEGTTGGTIFAADGGTVLLGSLHGGTLATQGSGVIKGGSSTITINFDNVHNTGNLQTAPITSVSGYPTGTNILGEFVNDGVVTGAIIPAHYLKFSGSGQWISTGFSFLFPDTLIVNGPQHTII